MQLINQQAEFTAICQKIQASEKIISIDTEFCRRRTYFAKLSIVQLATKQSCFILDILALTDLTPLDELLNDQEIVKIFHSPDQDFSIFYHLFNRLPRNIFDTQLAAGVIGFEYGLGYASLCKSLLNIQLDKSMQTANWIVRPLPKELLTYAAKDVEYLPSLYRYLTNELDNRKLWPHYQLKAGKLTDIATYQFKPEKLVEKLLKRLWFNRKKPTISSKQLVKRLTELVILREDAAIYHDIPRNFCASDQDLLLLSEKLPKDEADLKKLYLEKNRLTKGIFREKLLDLGNVL